MKRKKSRFYSILILVMVLTVHILSMPVYAETAVDRGNKTIPFWVQTDIGPQVFAANMTYELQETYTPTGSSIRYTQHNTYLCVTEWSGSAFCDIGLLRPNIVKFYDSNENYIKQATLWVDNSPFISGGGWHFYRYISTDIATVNTSVSTATCQFTVYADDPLSAFNITNASVTCN